MTSSWAWASIVGLTIAVIFLVVLAWLQAGRLDDLEARVTTFETIRIEYVAPAGDSG